MKAITVAGGQAAALAVDVRDEDYACSLVKFAVGRYARLQFTFNNAGTLGEAGPSTDVSKLGWAETLETNFTGAFLCAKHQVAQMVLNGGGSIIFTST